MNPGTRRVSARNGIERIADERRRQREKLGWSAMHDDDHEGGEMAMAAACYAADSKLYVREDYAGAVHFVDPWPWETHKDARTYTGNEPDPGKESNAKRIRLLEKAGALIAAEIDRLLRQKRGASR